MTEIFKCRKAGTKCCAPKSLIKEALGHKDTDLSLDNSVQETVASLVNTTMQTVTEFSTSKS